MIVGRLECVTDELTISFEVFGEGEDSFYYGISNLALEGFNRCGMGCKCCPYDVKEELCMECFASKKHECFDG